MLISDPIIPYASVCNEGSTTLHAIGKVWKKTTTTKQSNKGAVKRTKL